MIHSSGTKIRKKNNIGTIKIRTIESRKELDSAREIRTIEIVLESQSVRISIGESKSSTIPLISDIVFC